MKKPESIDVCRIITITMIRFLRAGFHFSDPMYDPTLPLPSNHQLPSMLTLIRS